MGVEEVQTGDGESDLARALEVLANPVRLALLHRLGTPSFMPDLAKEFGITRQALKKHLDDLEGVGLVRSRQARRGALPAMEYTADPAGLFALKDRVLGIAVDMEAGALPPAPTMPSGAARPAPGGSGIGLLMVHGDAPGRWFTLSGKSAWVLGRDPQADIPLSYDPFASARHALLRSGPDGWTLSDLQSRNGTRLNFRPIPSGATVPLRPGDLVTVGKSHLLVRDGP